MPCFLKTSLLPFLCLLFLSCTERPAPPQPPKAPAPSTSPTLTFTSGIRAIFQDRNGHYWLGSHAEGVCRFDGQLFEYFTLAEGLPHHQVRSIQEDEQGTIWLGTAEGVAHYNGTTFTVHTPVQGGYLLQGWAKKANDRWFSAGNQAGVYRYHNRQLRYLAFPLPDAPAPEQVYHTTDIATGKDGMIWIATYSGVFGYNGRSFTIINNAQLGLTRATGVLHVRSIFEDSKGRLWIGNNGIGVLLRENGTLLNFSEQQQLIHPNSTRNGHTSPAGTLEHVFAITEDQHGNIWFGDRDTGAWKYDGKTMTHYTIDPTLSSPMIWDIYEDRDKNLLFALADGGVYQFNGQSFNRRF